MHFCVKLWYSIHAIIERLWVVEGLKGHYKNARNEWIVNFLSFINCFWFVICLLMIRGCQPPPLFLTINEHKQHSILSSIIFSENARVGTRFSREISHCTDRQWFVYRKWPKSIYATIQILTLAIVFNSRPPTHLDSCNTKSPHYALSLPKDLWQESIRRLHFRIRLIPNPILVANCTLELPQTNICFGHTNIIL